MAERDREINRERQSSPRRRSRSPTPGQISLSLSGSLPLLFISLFLPLHSPSLHLVHASRRETAPSVWDCALETGEYCENSEKTHVKFQKGNVIRRLDQQSLLLHIRAPRHELLEYPHLATHLTAAFLSLPLYPSPPTHPGQK